jgi:flagellar hook-basal body complex protein FliE
MAVAINPISSPAIPNGTPAGGRMEPGGSFADVLSDAIQSVNNLGQQASGSIENFLTGEGEDLHSTVLATTRAELAFDLFLQTRNKVVSAYQEIMRMQL